MFDKIDLEYMEKLRASLEVFGDNPSSQTEIPGAITLLARIVVALHDRIKVLESNNEEKEL